MNLNFIQKNKISPSPQISLKDIYKSEPTSEMFGALGWLSEINLYKKTANNSNHLFSPKILFNRFLKYIENIQSMQHTIKKQLLLKTYSNISIKQL